VIPLWERKQLLAEATQLRALAEELTRLTRERSKLIKRQLAYGDVPREKFAALKQEEHRFWAKWAGVTHRNLFIFEN
jgi:hypothetical protein